MVSFESIKKLSSNWMNNESSKSTVEVEDKVDKLCDLVAQTAQALKENRVLVERLAAFDTGGSVAQVGTAQRPPGDGWTLGNEEQ